MPLVSVVHKMLGEHNTPNAGEYRKRKNNNNMPE